MKNNTPSSEMSTNKNTLSPEDTVLVKKISESFYASLKADFTDEEWAEMREQNREYKETNQEGICASHNFCDANVNMFAAASAHVEGEFDYMDPHGQTIWNSAWARTQTKYLTAE